MHCPVCGEIYKNDDVVLLDEGNGTTHRKCYNKNSEQIKDVGSYREITNKYDFFESVRTP
ncbi:hypothetical protein GCM10007063_21060 [Lentibacillus kapialis]|uniref:Uncharacterized protein n=2 Tax=Lentibacillus kapialis TaxID=340214 RepID=A0A917PXZ6_9BACI|nr:hypothetical protein GCM10007063_21060 [Lentibacillus kapialis]